MAAPNSYPLASYIPAFQRMEVPAAQALRFARGETTRMHPDVLDRLRNSDLSFLEGIGGVRTQNFYWQWGAAEKNYALRERLAAQSLEHIPTANEITQGRYPRARGFQHNVDVLAYDKVAGSIFTTPMSVVSSRLLAHGEAIEQAIANLRALQGSVHASGNRDSVPFQILSGGFVTGVIERLPELDDIDIPGLE